MSSLSSTSPLRTGIASGSLPGANRNSGGYSIYATSSNPQDTIKAKIANSVLQDSGEFSFPPDLPPLHMNIMENDWEAFSGVLKPKRIYRLPLPLQMKDGFDVQYDTNFSLNPVTGLLQAITPSVLAAPAVGASSGLGVTMNTFKTVTLSQPNFRRHQFSWKLAPKTFRESETIQKIGFQLRKGMTPKRVKNTAQVVMSFPYIYVCWFAPNSKFLYKFKPCVLERIEIDYGGGNPAPAFYRPEGAAENVAPESIVLTITLLELEYWLDSRDDNELSDYKQAGNMPTAEPLDSFNYYSIKTPTTAPTGHPLQSPLQTGTTGGTGLPTNVPVTHLGAAR